MFCVSKFEAVYSARKARRITLVAGATLWLGGCAMSMPLGSLFGSAGTDTTGSIAPRDGRFTNTMTDADWSKARGAVQVALDPANAGKPAPWDNPDSGLKGAVTSIAGAFAEQNRTCRAFIATLAEGTDTHWFQGHACAADGNAWIVTSTAPWMPPRAP